MFNRIIQFAVEKRIIVIAAAVILLIAGSFSIVRTPIDVLPDFNRPVVTIFTEAHGLAPEEVETLITLPVESAVNGATNVVRVRSISGIGLSIVFVEFDWNTDIYANRQVVSERLQRISSRLPGVTPVLGPISSIMGSISLIGFRSTTGRTSPVEVRTLVDWVVRPRLQAIPGVSQIINLGGGEKEYQVLLQPDQMRQYGLSLREIQEAIAASNQNTSGGYLELADREYLVRNLGRIRDVGDLENTAVTTPRGESIYLRNIARVTVGEKVKRGDAGINGRPAVITNVFMHTGANTIEVTRQVDRALDELRTAFPEDIEIDRDVFRQADFIQSAVNNIKESMRDASLLVLLVLPIFLLNFRTTFITMTAIPLSFVLMALIMRLSGFTINTMTLGGLALAVGEVVDDAIIDVENIYRRLKQNRQSARPRPALEVIRDASIEVRHAVLYSTYLVILIFIPLLFLTGVEARIFMPLGIAFILSIIASTVVAVVIVPALSAYLLPGARFLENRSESLLVRWLKKTETRALDWSLGHTGAVLFLTGAALLISLALLPFMGLEFMPPFNEGSFTVNVLAEPGISLTESNRIGVQAEQLLLKIPEVRSTGRRTGRAELDDHAEPVNYTEIEVALKKSPRSSEQIAQEIRQKLSVIPGVVIAVGQPISHKIDHLLSGVSAQVAVKVFGSDRAVLQESANRLKQIMSSVRGVVDLQMENQVPIPQVRIQVDRRAAGLYGFQPGEINEVLETYLNGRVVSQMLEGQKSFDILLRLDEPYRKDTGSLQNLLIDSPRGGKIPLKQLATVELSEGPNQILRENAQRRIVVQCNVSGRDLGNTVTEIRSRVQKELTLPQGYFILFGGQFESQQEATRTILVTSIFVIIAIFVLLLYRFDSARVAALIMVNLPLAAIGSIIGVFWTGGVLSVASLIGFIAVCSIASRTSLMLLSHYVHMMRHEGQEFGKQLVVRGALERLVPVMMTSSTAALGLIPLVLARGETGKEVLYPVAVVLLGGLISSTLLVMIVVPALFHKLGRPIWEKILEEKGGTAWYERPAISEAEGSPQPKIAQIGKNA